jgi:GT2 family glycosyltransferase
MITKRYPISIQLVTYNGAAWLPWCLESLLRSSEQNFFLMIIDNGSIDESWSIIQAFLKNNPILASHSRVVQNKLNLGFARAHNQALVWTNSDFVLLLNQDVLLDENYIKICSTCLVKRPDVAAVTGKILQWNFDSDNFHPTELKNLQAVSKIDSIGLGIKRTRQVINLGAGTVDHRQYESECEIFGVPGTAPMYRRTALNEISYNEEIFDNDFVSYKEDVDLAWRLRLAGFNAWYLPQAVAYHDRSLGGDNGWREQIKKRKSWPREFKIYSWVNHLASLLKNDSFSNIFLDLPWIVIHEFKKILYLLIFDPLVLTGGIRRLVRLFTRFLTKRRSSKKTHKIKPINLRKYWRRAK